MRGVLAKLLTHQEEASLCSLFPSSFPRHTKTHAPHTLPHPNPHMLSQASSTRRALASTSQRGALASHRSLRAVVPRPAGWAHRRRATVVAHNELNKW